MSSAPLSRVDHEVVESDIGEIANPLAVTRQTGAIESVSKQILTNHLPRFALRISLQTRNVVFAILALLLVASGIYGGAIFKESKVDDNLSFPASLRQNWSVPWVGVSASLLEREVEEKGWASDADIWSPKARLTSLPAFQSAMAESLGDFLALTALQIGESDDASDLTTAAKLLSGPVNADEARAARTALISFDGRVRRHTIALNGGAEHFAQRLDLMASWAKHLSNELGVVAKTAKGSPLDETAVVAVYRARGYAYVAHRLMDTSDHPYGTESESARRAALKAWAAAAAFEPVIVLNGAPDGLLTSSHPASMHFLLSEAERATRLYAASVRPDEASNETAIALASYSLQ